MKKLLLTAIIAACSYGSLHSQSLPKNVLNDYSLSSSKKQAVSMSVLEDCFYKAKEIRYMFDKKNNMDIEYWQSPSETDSLKMGDCEDKAIYLQKLLKDRGIFSEITAGKQSLDDTFNHAWVEMNSNDTTYVLDPDTDLDIMFRNGPGIGGTIPYRSYSLWDSPTQISKLKTLLYKYYMRTNDSLVVKNNLTVPNVNMDTVMGAIDFVSAIKYIPDSISNKNYNYLGNDYWSNPLETQIMMVGDDEDKAIFMQYKLQSSGIYCELVDGKYSSSDSEYGVWIEFDSSDTTYVIDVVKSKIFYRDGPKIKGNVPKDTYVTSYDLRRYIDLKTIEFHMRNDYYLDFKNRD